MCQVVHIFQRNAIFANFDSLVINCNLTVTELEPSRASDTFRFQDT